LIKVPGIPGPFFLKETEMKVTVIGLGLIGGSLAKDLRRTKFATKLTGVDSNEFHAREALELGLVDRIESFEQGIKNADLVIIAIPVDKELEVLPAVLDGVARNTTVTDMGSTKKVIADSIKNHPKRKQFVPAHPMSGTENSGPAAAIDDLFRGKIAIICDHEASGPQHLALIEKMFQVLGMDMPFRPKQTVTLFSIWPAVDFGQQSGSPKAHARCGNPFLNKTINTWLIL